MAKSVSVDRFSIGGRIRTARELVKKRSQDDLAKAIGWTRGAVSNWERGEGVSEEALIAIAKETKVSLGWLSSGDGSMMAADTPSEPRNVKQDGPAIHAERVEKQSVEDLFSTSDKLPVYAAIENGAGMSITETIIGEAVRYDSLIGIEGAYAIKVAGRSMAKFINPGDIICMHPLLPYDLGDKVLICSASANGEPPRGTIGFLVSYNDTEWTLEQTNPPGAITLPRSMWDKCHRIVMIAPRT